MKRRPRIVTWKLCVATIVIALLLSALSAPVGSFITQKWIAGKGLGYEYTELIHDNGGRSMRYVGHYGAIWIAHETGEGEWPTILEYSHDAVGPRAELPAPWWARYANVHEDDAGNIRASGWPLPSAYSRSFRWSDSEEAILPHQGLIIIGKAKPLFFDFLPLWPGLLCNTAVYSAVIAVPWILLRWRRLSRRCKRNQCLACGYQLTDGLERCPECGLGRAKA